jgi:hypothetical protein
MHIRRSIRFLEDSWELRSAISGVESATRLVNWNLMARSKKRGRPRIRTADYWREYYTRKQREWRAAHPRTSTPRRPGQRKAMTTARASG